MTDTVLIERLLNGESLCCIMQPDDVIPSNAPLHDENFHLPHIICCGNEIIAMTRADVMITGYAYLLYYTNFGIFGSYSSAPDRGIKVPDSPNFTISTLKRYKKHAFLTKNDYEKVWDSQEKNDLARLRAAVLDCDELKVAFIDEDDFWNIHPVILPQIECQSENFLLQTLMIHYPMPFRDFQGIHDRYINDNMQFITDESVYQRALCGLKSHSFFASYHIKADGTYKSAYDVKRRNTQHDYKHLKVFARMKE